MQLLPTPFIFMRHGETDYNRDNRAMGHLDIPLNKKGIEQAHQAAMLLQKQPFTKIFTSPLARAKTTAEIIAQKKEEAGAPVAIQIEPDLREASWGEHDGTLKASWMQDWYQGAHYKEGESFLEFQERVKKVMHKILGHEKGPILIISHGGVYLAIQKLLKLPSSDIANAIPIYHRPPEAKIDTHGQLYTPDVSWSAYSLEP